MFTTCAFSPSFRSTSEAETSCSRSTCPDALSSATYTHTKRVRLWSLLVVRGLPADLTSSLSSFFPNSSVLKPCRTPSSNTVSNSSHPIAFSNIFMAPLPSHYYLTTNALTSLHRFLPRSYIKSKIVIITSNYSFTIFIEGSVILETKMHFYICKEYSSLPVNNLHNDKIKGPEKYYVNSIYELV